MLSAATPLMLVEPSALGVPVLCTETVGATLSMARARRRSAASVCEADVNPLGSSTPPHPSVERHAAALATASTDRFKFNFITEFLSRQKRTCKIGRHRLAIEPSKDQGRVCLSAGKFCIESGAKGAHELLQ
jgi:hypothetical protein